MIKEIVCNNLSYSIDSKRILNSLSVRLNQGKIGLIGSNGVGKTTLIRLLVGQLQPNEGSIFINGTIGYLPQDLSGYWHGSIAAVLGIEQNLQALEAITAGNGDFHDFDIIGDDWDIRERALKVLDQVNLGYLTITRNFATLSGSEKMRAAMACIFMGDNPPQLVILDEPTNNMDLESIHALESALGKYQGALLIVSHDKLFLENIGVEVYVSLGAKCTQGF